MAFINQLSLTPIISSSIPPSDMRGELYSPVLSNDGQILVFGTSQALVADDTNGVSNVYVKNFATNTLRRVVLALDDANPDVRAGELSLSADGRYLAFTASKTDSVTQVYVKDLQTGTVTLASSTATGSGADLYCSAPMISADGHSVTFLSKATNLAAIDPHNQDQAWIKNLQTGALTLVSSDANGNPGLNDARAPSVSGDGRYVVFNSESTNLIDFGGNGNRKVYVKDTQTGAIALANPDTAGNITLRFGDHGHISANGQFVVYDSWTSLLPEDVNGTSDVYVKNLQTGVSQLVTPFGQLAKSYGESYADAISADGRYVLFHAGISDFSGNDDIAVSQTGPVNYYNQYYVRDLASGALTRLSAANNGDLADGANTLAVLAADGKSAVFVSDAGNLGGPAGKETLYRAVLGAQVSNGNGEFDDQAMANQVLTGGDGDDSYLINNAGSKIVELPGQGTDRVVSYVESYTLPANVEALQLRGTVAVHAIGNDGANVIRGNSQDNLLEGMGGDDVFYNSYGSDTIDGGAGFDTAIYNSYRFQISLHQTGAGKFELVYLDLPEGNHDNLIGVERLHLNDVTVALDIDGAAGQAFRIYQAAFNRTPDQAGLGYWINAIDHGAALNEVARGFVNSAEFSALYGSNPANADIVTRLYANVLHRAPDAGGAAFWTDVLDGHRATVPEVLAQFSESPENKAALVGVTHNGIDFIPFA